MFHAAALRYGGIGCLITGKSGSGKSTMTAAAVSRGFETAGDDFVLIETEGTPRAHAVFDTIKLDEHGLTEFRNSVRSSETPRVLRKIRRSCIPRRRARSHSLWISGFGRSCMRA